MSFLLKAFCLGLMMVVTSHASGTYRFSPPRPPTVDGQNLDDELYARGRNLFTAKSAPSGKALPGLVSYQKVRLDILQSKLPRSIQERVDLLALAPLLSPTEMAALEYYTILRYKMDLNSGGEL